MTNIVPGALWHPIDVGNRAKRSKGRGLIGHVAVSNSTLLLPGPLATRPSDWTFYLPKQPYPTGERFAQLIDLDLQCWSSAAGNATCPAFESQGGMGATAQVNAEPWTDNQVESAAIILAHLHTTEGVPLQDMGNSLAASRGFGVHRYGISPWRVAGGEVWSSANGKLCPGDAKVRQIPAIVARAQQIVNGDDIVTEADKADLVHRILDTDLGGGSLSDYVRKMRQSLNSANHPGDDDDDQYGHTLSAHKYAKQAADTLAKGSPSAPSVNVDASAVATSLAGNQSFLDALADALAVKLGSRLSNG